MDDDPITIRQVLEALAPVLSGVHGYCIVCVEDLARDVNAALEGLNVPYRYRVLQEGAERYRPDIRLSLVDLREGC